MSTTMEVQIEQTSTTLNPRESKSSILGPSEDSPPSEARRAGTVALDSQVGERSQLVREVACHSTLVIAGWSDASSGPLIPYIQRYYGISYTVVSMLFVGQMVGFLTAGGSVGYLMNRFGLASEWLSRMKFGLLHASYGLGALVCPLAATAFASSNIQFSYFYGISVGLSLVNLAILIWSFRLSYRVEEAPPSSEVEEVELQNMGELPRDDSQGETTSVEGANRERGMLYQTLSNRTVLVFAAFILVYVGAEVSMGGWIVTFIIDERDGGPSAGYVATGFWGGITLGRAILPWLNVRVGERQVVWYYLLVASALEFAIWFSKNLVGNAVTVAIIGFAIAPLYPIVMSLATKLLPRHLHSSAIGFIAAIGQTGSAIFPFTTGALAQRYSTYALQPVMLALFVAMGAIWWWVPPVDQKEE